MEKLQIPKGKYDYRKDSGLEYPAVKLAGSPVMIIYAEFLDDNGNCDDIVLVASDALNTYQQCETLPRELLRQNMEMKEALESTLKEFQKLIDHCENEHFLDFDDESIEGVANCNKVMKQARNLLTSCNKGKE